MNVCLEKSSFQEPNSDHRPILGPQEGFKVKHKNIKSFKEDYNTTIHEKTMPAFSDDVDFKLLKL